MRHTIWSRPIPRWAKMGLAVSAASLATLGAVALIAWIQFHRTYEEWLNSPPERLQSFPAVLVARGAVQEHAAESALEAQVDAALLTWRGEFDSVVEMSRSDVLQYSLLGLAYVKVYLHTRLPDGSADQRIEFVAEFARRGGQWTLRETFNLALP